MAIRDVGVVVLVSRGRVMRMAPWTSSRHDAKHEGDKGKGSREGVELCKHREVLDSV